MKQLLVISGKGGTGKTTIAGSLAHLAPKVVLADCDVDAANLHLVLGPKVQEVHDFTGLPKPRVDLERCAACGRCTEVCRFGAISNGMVDLLSCEGCAVCSRVCPHGAIELVEHVAGHWFVSTTQFGPMVHARLGIAEENSGKLVAEVRRAASRLAQGSGIPLVLIDGPPGAGCPVISSLTGVDVALLVIEPGICGWHDARRVIKLARRFQVTVVACINKCDLVPESREVEWGCYDEGVPVLGRIPFDEKVLQATEGGVPVTVIGGKAATELRCLWAGLQPYLEHA